MEASWIIIACVIALLLISLLFLVFGIYLLHKAVKYKSSNETGETGMDTFGRALSGSALAVIGLICLRFGIPYLWSLF